MFEITVNDPYAEDPRRSFDFKVETVREAAIHFEDLTGVRFEEAVADLVAEDHLSFEDEYGRTVEVRLLVGAVV